jgi:hypothetical protein
MLKVRFFLNEPNGDSCKHFKKMMPKFDEKYDIEIEITSKAKPEYLTDEYFALDLPVAPAIMVGEEIVTEGKDVDDHTLEAAICMQLGLPEPEEEKRGIVGRFFNK